MELLQHHQNNEWRVYPKWTKGGTYGNQNHGDVPRLANEWLKIQGQTADDGSIFDRNAGRKSLARWLEHLDVPYRESVNIHGDLEDVWRHSYQDKLPKSHYRSREQSTNPDTSLKGLKRFVKFIHGARTRSFREQLQLFMDGQLS